MTVGDSFRTCAYRVGNVALLDLGATLLLAVILAFIYNRRVHGYRGVSIDVVLRIFIALMFAGVLAHVATGTPTFLNYTLGLSERPPLSMCNDCTCP
jgi:hypothetical protein